MDIRTALILMGSGVEPCDPGESEGALCPVCWHLFPHLEPGALCPNCTDDDAARVEYDRVLVAVKHRQRARRWPRREDIQH